VRGPLVDRIDIHHAVPAVKCRELSERAGGKPRATPSASGWTGAGDPAGAFRGASGRVPDAHTGPRDLRAHWRVAEEAGRFAARRVTPAGPFRADC